MNVKISDFPYRTGTDFVNVKQQFPQNRLNVFTLDSIALQSYMLLQRPDKVLTVFSGVKNLNCWIMF